MATAEQIKMLIRSHLDGNDDRFKTVVLQLAAYEANQGHGAFAREIRDIVEKAKNVRAKVIPFNRDMNELVLTAVAERRLSELVVENEIKTRVERILNEFRQQDKI